MEYITIRHAQHVATENDPLSDDLGLTLGGIDEARQIGDLIRGREVNKAYTFDSKRALSTVALSLNNELVTDEVPSSVYLYRKFKKIEVDDNFDYLPIYPGEYRDKLFASFAENRQMAFTVFESDKYQSKERPVSTCSAMAKIGAESVMRYFEGGNFQQVVTCAREFVFPSLVAKLLTEHKGEGAADDYVQWYTETIEAKGAARLTTITFKKKEGRAAVGLEIVSGYGHTTIDYDRFQKTTVDLAIS